MKKWEHYDDDEEVVENDEEVVVDESEERDAGEGEEVVEEEEEVVGGPRGDPVLEFVYGLTSEVPRSFGEWRFPWLLLELSKAERKGDGELARRWARLAFEACPLKPRLCPLYSVTTRCEFGMERYCRPRAWARARRQLKKTRSWYRKRAPCSRGSSERFKRGRLQPSLGH